jgi:hypothetical protein
LEEEIKLFVEQFLQERGLELSPATTVITHVGKGLIPRTKRAQSIPTGNCSSSLARTRLRLSWPASGRRPKLGMSAADLIYLGITSRFLMSCPQSVADANEPAEGCPIPNIRFRL